MSFNKSTPGQRFRDAVASEHPLQVVGAINANHALLAPSVCQTWASPAWTTC